MQFNEQFFSVIFFGFQAHDRELRVSESYESFGEHNTTERADIGISIGGVGAEEKKSFDYYDEAHGDVKEDGEERDAICNASTCLFCLIESEKDEKKDEENGRCLVDWKYMEE